MTEDEIRANFVVDQSGCWIWQGAKMATGYGEVSYEKRVWYVHRLIWTLEFGPIPEGSYVLHSCDVRPCGNPEHLFLGDALANMRDMIAKGRERHPAGEDHPRAKLTEAQVREIRRRLDAGETHRALAAEYGVGQSTIGHISTRRIWRNTP